MQGRCQLWPGAWAGPHLDSGVDQDLHADLAGPERRPRPRCSCWARSGGRGNLRPEALSPQSRARALSTVPPLGRARASAPRSVLFLTRLRAGLACDTGCMTLDASAQIPGAGEASGVGDTPHDERGGPEKPAPCTMGSGHQLKSQKTGRRRASVASCAYRGLINSIGPVPRIRESTARRRRVTGGLRRIFSPDGPDRGAERELEVESPYACAGQREAPRSRSLRGSAWRGNRFNLRCRQQLFVEA